MSRAGKTDPVDQVCRMESCHRFQSCMKSRKANSKGTCSPNLFHTQFTNSYLKVAFMTKIMSAGCILTQTHAH